MRRAFLCHQTLVPAGYLIPISHQSLISDKDIQDSVRENNKASTPTYNIYQTPTAGTIFHKAGLSFQVARWFLMNSFV